MFVPEVDSIDLVKFTVYGEAKVKREGRTTVRYAKGGKPFAQHYQPHSVRFWQEQVEIKAKEVAPPEFWKDGPVSVTMIFLMMRPKSVPKKLIWRDKQRDPDRLACAILDAMERVIYANDGQVAHMSLFKLYTDGRPSVTVLARKLDPFRHSPFSQLAYEWALQEVS